MINQIKKINTISEFHRLRGLAKPTHPLISLIDYARIIDYPENNHIHWLHNFYSIAMKKNLDAKMMYGQQAYDFDEGLMSFLAPKQLLNIIVTDKAQNNNRSGWLLFFHKDFIWNTPLAKSIGNYDFFDYAINEALFLSEREETIIASVFQNINEEINSQIDAFSQNIIITQIELLLNYSKRFYNRQFITRQKVNHQILVKLEKMLKDYLDKEDLIDKGLPTVQYVAQALNISPNYLSNLLKSLIGLNTRQYIHQKLIEKAKEKLSTTHLSVSEIAYELGFEHVQSFSKLFKAKANQSPSEFRASFH